MQMSLSKMSWKAQVGVFLAICAGRCRRVLLVLRDAARRTRWRSGRRSSPALQADIDKGAATARRLPRVPRGGGRSAGASRQPAHGAPRGKRRGRSAPAPSDARDAVESADQGLQAGGDRDEADARGVADQSRARRHVPQPRALLRSGGRSSPESSTSTPMHIKAKDKPTTDRRSRPSCIATTFVLFEETAATKGGGRTAVRWSRVPSLTKAAVTRALASLHARAARRGGTGAGDAARARRQRPRRIRGSACAGRGGSRPPRPRGRHLHLRAGGPARSVREPPVARQGGEGAAEDCPAPDGSPASASTEVSVRGVMQSRGGYVAIVQGTDNKTYLARPNATTCTTAPSAPSLRRGWCPAGSQRPAVPREAERSSQGTAAADEGK